MKEKQKNSTSIEISKLLVEVLNYMQIDHKCKCNRIYKGQLDWRIITIEHHTFLLCSQCINSINSIPTHDLKHNKNFFTPTKNFFMEAQDA